MFEVRLSSGFFLCLPRTRVVMSINHESVTFFQFLRAHFIYEHPDNKDTMSCPHGVRINWSPVFCPYYSSFRITRISFFELILLSRRHPMIWMWWRRGSNRPLGALFVVHLQSALSVINVHKTRSFFRFIDRRTVSEKITITRGNHWLRIRVRHPRKRNRVERSPVSGTKPCFKGLFCIFLVHSFNWRISPCHVQEDNILLFLKHNRFILLHTARPAKFCKVPVYGRNRKVNF